MRLLRLYTDIVMLGIPVALAWLAYTTGVNSAWYWVTITAVLLYWLVRWKP